jgi:hypothetical protein
MSRDIRQIMIREQFTLINYDYNKYSIVRDDILLLGSEGRTINDSNIRDHCLVYDGEKISVVLGQQSTTSTEEIYVCNPSTGIVDLALLQFYEHNLSYSYSLCYLTDKNELYFSMTSCTTVHVIPGVKAFSSYYAGVVYELLNGNKYFYHYPDRIGPIEIKTELSVEKYWGKCSSNDISTLSEDLGLDVVSIHSSNKFCLVRH